VLGLRFWPKVAPSLDPRPNTQHPATVVEALALSKTYTMGSLRVPALRSVSLTISRGEIVAIVGPSGCGKTTLLHCLSGLEDFETGDVWLEGRALKRLSDAAKADHRARRVGFVFQSYNLLPVLNALENVELPLLLAGRSAGEARRRALRALEVVGLENRLRHRPSELSGGQQQRVAVARALAPEPAVIFADEPTGNLDSDSAHEIMHLITRLNRDNQQTFVLVTHAREVAACARRVIRMRDGEIEADEATPGAPSHDPGPGLSQHVKSAEAEQLPGRGPRNEERRLGMGDWPEG
jgi:putative ABC transport system ATP-binding protein